MGERNFLNNLFSAGFKDVNTLMGIKKAPKIVEALNAPAHKFFYCFFKVFVKHLGIKNAP